VREIRDFAKLQNDAGETIAHAEAGMKEKAQEFREKGGKLYPEKVE